MAILTDATVTVQPTDGNPRLLIRAMLPDIRTGARIPAVPPALSRPFAAGVA